MASAYIMGEGVLVGQVYLNRQIYGLECLDCAIAPGVLFFTPRTLREHFQKHDGIFQKTWDWLNASV